MCEQQFEPKRSVMDSKGNMRPKDRIALTPVIVTITLSLLCLTGCSIVAEKIVLNHPKVKKLFETPLPDRTLSGKAWTNSIGDGTNRILVLHLTGSNYFSLGYNQGRLLAREIEAAYEDAFAGAEKQIPRKAAEKLSAGGKRRIVHHVLGEAWKKMRPFVSAEELEEMEGLAAGLRDAGIVGIDLATIHHLNAIPDFSQMGCSGVIAYGDATRGDVWQMRLLDYGLELGLHKRPMITVYHPVNTFDNTIVNVGWVGLAGMVTGVNNRGVAISEMRYNSIEGKTLAGEPMVFLMKRSLRFGNSAPEVVSIMRSAKRTNGYGYLVGDREKNAIGVLASANEFVEFRPNTAKVLERGKDVLPQYKDVLYCGHYNDRQAASVQKLHGTLALSTLQEMALSIAPESNLQVVVFNLTTGDLWVANKRGKGRAADTTYVKFPRDAWEK